MIRSREQKSKLQLKGIFFLGIFALSNFSLFSGNGVAQDPFLRQEMEIEGNANIEGSANEEDSTDEAKPAPTAKPQPFPGYGGFREILREYCKQLISDGNSDRVQRIIEILLVERADCRHCRQLYKALSCKLTAKQAAQGIPRRASPRTELLAILSDVFGKIAANPALSTPTAEAMTPILAALSQPENPISDAYFETFVAFVSAPLKNELEQAKQVEKKQQGKIKAKKLDALF